MTETYRIRKPATLTEIPHDNHAVIEASAGTGKTYTIEHMVVDLLLADPELRIAEILIVTFTERATSELKGRIRKLLQAIVDGDEEVLAKSYEPAWEIGRDERRRLQRALSSFDLAPIHTIHGFCHRVLTENAFQNNRLFDQNHTDFDVIFERVFKEALRREFAFRDEFRPYLSAWLEAKDRAVERLQSIMAECVRSRGEIRPTFDEAALRAALDAFGVLGEPGTAEVVEDLRAELKAEGVHHATVKAACGRAATLLDAVESYRETGEVAPFLAVASDKDVYDYLDEKLASYSFDGPVGSLIRQAHEAVVPIEAAVVGKFLPTLRRMLAAYKEQQGHFSYDDMLSFVWDSLESGRGEGLVEQLRERYRYALIDEFQDTDDLQWKIFRHIYHDSKDNVFYLIGDPKQAIYSFRGADVYTYLDAKETVLDAGGALVRLDKNYRSSLGVISAYNEIFDQEASPPFFTGDISYDTPVECALADRTLVDGDDELASPVQLVQLIDDDLDASKLKDGFAAYFASEIRRILDEDGRLFVRETAKSPPRAISASDIYILTRSRTDGRRLAEHLRREGIPHAFFKQDGLFQTAEASHILELLRAVARPHDRSRRLKGWLTPFFGLEIDELEDADELPETEPLLRDLFDWHQLAERRWFETLFNDILTRSGLLRREIFTSTSERALTNYLHIFELLLEEAGQNGLNLDELILRLEAFIAGEQVPSGEDGNVQRLETDGDAVQIMTMHKAKGLEAEVVFVYGGFGRAPSGGLYSFHGDDGQPVLQIGSPPATDKERWAQEQFEEEQRLMYVALTRAKSRLYLPYIGFENGESKDDAPVRDYAIDGTYAALLPRLDAICERLSEAKDYPHFELEQVEYARTITVRDFEAEKAAISRWTPPEELPEPFDDDEFRPYRTRRHTVSSYSRIKGERSRRSEIEPEEFKADEAQPISELLEDRALPGGKRAGVFLHELVENVDFDHINGFEALDGWLEDDEVDADFKARMRQHSVDASYLEFCKELVWRSLKTPLGGPDELPCVAESDRALRELEFVYPIPEASHPTLGDLGDADKNGKIDKPDKNIGKKTEWKIERGYIKGFVDLIFEADGRVYFADWKSDILADYTEEVLDAHVAERYAIQATIYSLAVVKFLDIRSKSAFEERFGGYLYLFMRGMDDGRGVYFRRPSWEDVVGYEQELRERVRF
ncbi:MAG: UvrD-helicase domain-containing protein [Persicimonas sp.]